MSDYFTDKYGPDFRKKLPHYKTAYYGDKCVSILKVNGDNIIISYKGEVFETSVYTLDNFCL